MKKIIIMALMLSSIIYLAMWMTWLFSFVLYIGGPEGAEMGDFLPWWSKFSFGHPVLSVFLFLGSVFALYFIPKIKVKH